MGRNSKIEERKQEILQGCYDVITQEGLESATLRRIGVERKIAPSLVSHYFKRKEDLIAELVDFTFDKEHKETIPDVMEGKTPEEKLERYIRKMVTLYLGQNVDDKVFYSCFYKSLYDEGIHKKFVDIYDPGKSLLGDIVREINEGRDTDKLDFEETVLFIHVFIEGINFIHVVLGENERYKNITDKFVKITMEMIRRKDFSLN